MSEENRKHYRKMSVECMVFSLVGVLLLVLLFGGINGGIRYLSKLAYEGLLLTGVTAFMIGLIGLIVTGNIKKDGKKPQ